MKRQSLHWHITLGCKQVVFIHINFSSILFCSSILIFIHYYVSSIIIVHPCTCGRIFLHIMIYFMPCVKEYFFNIPSMSIKYSQKNSILLTCSCSCSHIHHITSLNCAISMSLKFKDEIDYATFDNLMEEDGNVVYELSCLASNIKKEIIQVLDYFLSFLKKNEERKTHNMFSLMLDYRFKTLHLVSSLIGREQGKAIIEEYDKNLYFLCFSNVIIICIHWLNLKEVLIKGLKRT